MFVLLCTIMHWKYLDFQIVIPSLTNDEYQHMTYALRHKRHLNRVRRQASEEANSFENPELRYSLSAYGEDFHLHLEANHRLLSPTFSVRVVRNGSEEEYSGLEDADCHHQGWVTSHQSQPVAISTCDGLVSFILENRKKII